MKVTRSTKTKNSGLTAQHSVLYTALCALLLAFCVRVEAQPSKQVYRVGYLNLAPGGGVRASEDSLRSGLRDLGYIEGQNIIIESRFAEGKINRLPGLVTELIGQKVDIIVVTSIQGALAAKKATHSIPIVFAVAQDPVGTGLVTSLAQPGGNMTGVTDFARELAGKRLELVKETLPRISRVAVLLWKPHGPDYAAEKNEIEITAQMLRIELQPVEVATANDLEKASSKMIQAGANAFMTLTDTRIAVNRKAIIGLSMKSSLPAVFQDRLFAEAGGLMSYGTNRVEWRRRVAYYVDKILKGAKPADLPVEQPTKFELVINLKTAKQIGLTIPPNMLARADRVIR